MASEWYNTTVTRIDELRQTLTKSEARDCRLDKLATIARRVDEFAASDPICRDYQGEIDKILIKLMKAPLSPKDNRIYLCTLGTMVSHMKKTHHLVSEGEYMILAMIIGLAIGTSTGFIIGNPPLSSAIGLALGLIIGLNLETRAKRSGRTI